MTQAGAERLEEGRRLRAAAGQMRRQVRELLEECRRTWWAIRRSGLPLEERRPLYAALKRLRGRGRSWREIAGDSLLFVACGFDPLTVQQATEQVRALRLRAEGGEHG